MRPVPRIIRLNGLSAVIVAIAVAMGFYLFPDETHSAFVRWFLFPLSLALPVGLLLVPACWLGDKFAQSLTGRLPPDGLEGAKPVPFERPPDPDDETL